MPASFYKPHDFFTKGIVTWRSSRELPTVSPGLSRPFMEPFLKRPGGNASLASEILNLIKQILGAGLLGLPASIAAFGDHPDSMIPAAALICTIGTISAYGFALVGRICAQTEATSYREAWILTVDEKSSWVPAWACVLVACSSVITFSIALSDTIPGMLHPLLGFSVPKSTALIAVTTFVLLPLCLLKELNSLAPFSFIGIAAMVYTAAVMVERYLFGHYDEGSPFLNELPERHQPRFGSMGWEAVFSPNSALIISMLSTSFMAHYNAPKFFHELRNNTLDRFDAVVAYSFFCSMMLISTVTFAGFATFGAASQGVILNNYAVTDHLMSTSRIAVVFAVMFSYPLAFVGVRDGLFDLFCVSRRTRETTNEVISVILLLALSAAALVIRDIRVIMSFSGITWGNAVIYIFPGYMIIKGASKYPEFVPHLVPATLTALFGILLGVVGFLQAARNIFLTEVNS